jgi:hypothetical protein
MAHKISTFSELAINKLTNYILVMFCAEKEKMTGYCAIFQYMYTTCADKIQEINVYNSLPFLCVWSHQTPFF